MKKKISIKIYYPDNNTLVYTEVLSWACLKETGNILFVVTAHGQYAHYKMPFEVWEEDVDTKS